VGATWGWELGRIGYWRQDKRIKEQDERKRRGRRKNRGYYTAVRRYKFYVRVAKTIDIVLATRT